MIEPSVRYFSLGSRAWKPYPEYKDSGIEWLGEIPAHWELRRLGSTVASSQNGVWGDESQGDENDISCIRVADFDRQRLVVSEPSDGFTTRNVSGSQRSGRILEHDDLLLEKSGGGEKQLVGAVVRYQYERPAVCSNFVARLVPRDEHDTRFLTYLHFGLYSARVNLRSIKQNTGIQNLDEKQYFSESVGLPPQSEQQAIADFLDRETGKIDALVEKKELLIELLQEKRTALITHAVTKGLVPNAPLKDSGIEWLGRIPAHWGLSRLKHLLEPRKSALKTGPFGSQLQSSDMTGDAIKVYNQKNVINRDINDGENYISLQKFEELKAFEVFENDLLVTTRGTIGRCLVVPPKAERGILHPCLMRIQTKKSRILSRYLEILIQDSDQVLNQLRLMSNATTIDVIYSESLREVWLPVPPIDEQHKALDFLGHETAKIEALIGRIQEAIERLKEYRTALISAAVTGKIDVRGQPGEACS